ncbi:MAG TPA: DMT family transporter [Thermoanaerobaculia bacterium]|nr:DMT family transporter [Thermoanaerobaculia bacterium]
MQFAGELAALGTAACWVATALAFEAAGHRIGSLTVNLVRLVMAIGLLAGFSTLTRGLPFPTDASPHAWFWLSVSGLVGFTFGDLCLFRAFVVLGSRLSSLMMALAPPLAALLGWWLLGEVLSPRDGLGMVLTVGGVAWAIAERSRPAVAEAAGKVAAGKVAGTAENAREQGRNADRLASGRRWLGVALGLGGALGQAGGLVLSKLGMADYDPFAATQIRVLAGTAGYFVLFTLLGWWRRLPSALADRPAMRFTAVGAFFGPFLGVGLSLVAVQRIQTGVAASLMATTPVLIIPVVVWLGRERVGWGGVLGAVVAVAGVALLMLP